MADSREAGAHMRAELHSQPETWARAAEMRADQALLPPRGARVAVVGCGTSWFMAQAYASLRESAGLGETDAFAASEFPLGRDYDAIVALTRSGTTTEVLELAERLRGKMPLLAVVGDDASPLVDLSDTVIALPFADERSVVQTRFATTALALFRASTGEDLGCAIDDARAVLGRPSDDDPALSEADQYSFLGTGWTQALAHEAALKMREAAQAWTESYSSMEYRHGPIAIAAPGRIAWQFGRAPLGLEAQVVATGARFVRHAIDPMADLVRVHRIALERACALGLDPDRPRSLTRSVILDDRAAESVHE